MKNIKSAANINVPESKEKQPRTFSRRKILKGMILIPVQWGLLASAARASGIRSLFLTGREGHGDLIPAYPGNQGEDLYAPNRPMGKAQGIIPGRVTWVWNPSATNTACANIPISGNMSEDRYDAWFMDRNTNQDKVDSMLTAGLCSVTDRKEAGEVWDSLFRYHNQKRGKGQASYRKGEKIYLKLNRTTASSGMNREYERLKDKPLTLACETSPQLVLSILRQLVNVAGVPQQFIYVGDAMRNIYQDEYVKYHAEFPDVNYLSSFGSNSGRIRSTESGKDLIFYSDKKAVMNEAGADKLYSVLEEAEYLINLPAMKGHNIAGITLCAKNHFGTQTRSSASHLHPGLNNNTRRGYGHYRVLVDIMGNKYTGDKNLFYILDALWSGSNWNGLPVKFLMPPFDNNWSSSLFLSLDPVAIESVALDFLRTEFTRPEHTVAYISDAGVDDYLHQAADPGNWPAGIVYAPNGDGKAIPGSLGVHEHWNNSSDKQYSKNLGRTDGIELVKIFQKI